MPLSDTTIRTAKPKDKLYRLTDANGLCLEVTTTGTKLWRYRYRFNGNARMLALGTHRLTLTDDHGRSHGRVALYYLSTNPPAGVTV